MSVAEPVKDSIEKIMEVISMNTGNKVKLGELVDINDVVINPALDKDKRVQSFVQQIKNHYAIGVEIM